MASGPPRKKIHQADRAGIEFGAYELHSSTLNARPSCLTKAWCTGINVVFVIVWQSSAQFTWKIYYTVLTFATKHFLDIFLLKKSWKDRQRANGKLCWGDVGSNVFTTNNKICTLGYHITWYTLGCLCPTSELTVCIKPESVRQTPAQYNTLPSGDERQPW